MSVLVKGMEIPKNCWECPCDYGAFGECVCGLTEKSTREFREKRRDDCPIFLRVPAPHGRLIDASEEIQVQMYDDQHEDFYQEKMTIDDLLSQSWIDAKAPTVIPAEEEQ